MKITNIKWDRIYLEIFFDSDKAKKVCFINLDTKDKFYVPVTEKKIKLNITNIPGGRMLPEGNWQVMQCTKRGLRPIAITVKQAYQCENLDKVFLYYKNAYAYIVKIDLMDCEKDENLYCVIRTFYMQKNRKPEKRKASVEASSMKGKIKRLFINWAESFLRVLYKFAVMITKKDGKHILFMSETRTPISGNLKALDQRIKNRKLPYQTSYYFFKSLQQSEIKTLLCWMKLVFILAKQDYVFVDDYASIFRIIDLDKRTKLTQVWHAGVGFKSVGYARFGREGSPHPTVSCHRKYDYIVVGGEALIPVYQEVFGLDRNRFLPVGLPRLDGYLNKEKVNKSKKEIYLQYPQLKSRKVILFAPTYRGKGQAEAYYPYEKIDLQAIYRLCEEKDYMFAVKMHPFIKKRIEIPSEYASRIIDVTEYQDINELFYITNILITDFSSNIYEYSLQRKPIIFYAFDKDVYQIQHGVHRTLDIAPGKVCIRFEDVIQSIRDEDFELEKTLKFAKDNFSKEKTKSCDKIIDHVILSNKKDNILLK